MSEHRNSQFPEPSMASVKLEPCGGCAGQEPHMREESGNEESRIREVYAEQKGAFHAEKYSASNPAVVRMRRELERHLLADLQSLGCRPLGSKRILDVGCGFGYWLRKFREWGAKPENLYGIDLMADRVAKTREELPQAMVSVGNASKLEFADESFDLVAQFVMFSSILHAPTRSQIAREMIRVLKPGGHIIWWDFFLNNPWNRNVRGVGKREIRDVFPDCRIHFRRVTVAPPLTRHMGPLLPVLYPFLASLKICSTHYLALVEK